MNWKTIMQGVSTKSGSLSTIRQVKPPRFETGLVKMRKFLKSEDIFLAKKTEQVRDIHFERKPI
jgi:hypothetical protein